MHSHMRCGSALPSKASFTSHNRGSRRQGLASFPHVRGRWRAGACSTPTPDRRHVRPAGYRSRQGRNRFTRSGARPRTFLASHPSELMVLATHGRNGMPRWFDAFGRRSDVAPRANADAVHSRAVRGLCRFGNRRTSSRAHPRPRGPQPAPTGSAIAAVRRFCLALGRRRQSACFISAARRQLRRQGRRNFPVDLRNGDVVDTILQVAADMKANLIAMATAGHQGLLDAIRGSTTERVVRQAPCPVLAFRRRACLFVAARCARRCGRPTEAPIWSPRR